MLTAWLISFLRQANQPADTAEDLATLLVAFTDGMRIASQVYEDGDPGEYLDLIAGTIADALER